jgi:hypothetical protein
MPSKFEENPSADKWMLNYTRALTHALARVRAVSEHEKYVAHATWCDMLYVQHKFEENPSKDKRMPNYARARTCARARVRAVCENEKYVILATYGES